MFPSNKIVMKVYMKIFLKNKFLQLNYNIFGFSPLISPLCIFRGVLWISVIPFYCILKNQLFLMCFPVLSTFLLFLGISYLKMILLTKPYKFRSWCPEQVNCISLGLRVSRCDRLPYNELDKRKLLLKSGQIKQVHEYRPFEKNQKEAKISSK